MRKHFQFIFLELLPKLQCGGLIKINKYMYTKKNILVLNLQRRNELLFQNFHLTGVLEREEYKVRI